MRMAQSWPWDSQIAVKKKKKSVPAVTVDEGVSKMMCQLLKQQSVSDIDIDVFSGNPMDFSHFMATFNKILEKVDDCGGKLTWLIQYTAGDAKWQKITFSCLVRMDLKLPNDWSLTDMVTLTES